METAFQIAPREKMAAQNPGKLERSRRPVFVVGCHRSGTNLLYDTLLSAGGFAIYRGYLPVHKMLIPRFGRMSNIENRKNLIHAWMRSKGMRRAGLNADELTGKLLASANNGGEFIRIVMEEISQAQKTPRWAVYDADNVQYVSRIKSEIPDALFVHIVRDGRDVAFSLKKMGEFRPFPWRRKPASLEATALYWKWMVENGGAQGKSIPEDYIEIHFEDLVGSPERTLKALSIFLDHDLDYGRIRAASLGRLRESNSSFGPEGKQDAVNRWKEKLSSAEIVSLEELVGDCLEKSGYALTARPKRGPTAILRRAFYPAFLSLKRWLKVETAAGRFSSLAALELADGYDPSSKEE
jgi:hypothetical protein